MALMLNMHMYISNKYDIQHTLLFKLLTIEIVENDGYSWVNILLINLTSASMTS